MPIIVVLRKLRQESLGFENRKLSETPKKCSLTYLIKHIRGLPF